MTEAFILKVRTQLPDNVSPNPSQVYDNKLQLWVNTVTGAPVVTELCNDLKSSQFGETAETRAPEGVDQPVSACLLYSQI